MTSGGSRVSPDGLVDGLVRGLAAPKPTALDQALEAFETAGRKVVSALGMIGDLSAMVLDAVWSTVSALVHRRFSWSEFFEQTWFLISVCVLPTVLISIP